MTKNQTVSLVSELQSYCFSVGASDISTDIKYSGSNINILIKSNYDKKYLDVLNEANSLLNPIIKNIGMEMYWELLGSSDGVDIQLDIIGQLVSTADVVIEDSIFTMTIGVEM